MQGLKKFGLIICGALFGPILLLSVFSYSFSRTLGDQDYTKNTLTEAGFYSAAGASIKAEASGGGEGEPLIDTALESAVSEDVLRDTLEPLIDGTYSWLDGETQQPEFQLNIEPIKDNFEQNLTAALKARAAGLPVCTSAASQSGSDIFSYTCIPPGTDVDAVIADTVTRVSNNASLFSDEVVADGIVSAAEAEELGINDPTQNLPEDLPRFYQFFTGWFWVFVAGTVLTGVGVVFLSRGRLHGWRRLGVLLIMNGIGILVMSLIIGFIISSLVPVTSVDATEATINALQEASKVILRDSAAILKVVGLASTVLGVVSVIASSILLKKTSPPSAPENPVTPPKEKQPQPKL